MSTCKLAILMIVAALWAGGCTSVRTTDPPKTATEQFLMSTAAGDAVQQLSGEAMRGRTIYVDDSYMPAKSFPYLIGDVRAQLLLAGGQLVNDRDKAQIIVEVRSGGVGIDRYEFLLGIPALPIGTVAAAAGAPPVQISTPELALIKNTRQWGTASVALVAYWSDSGEIITASGPFVGRSHREDWWFFGSGPKSISDIPPTQPLE
jgi:hypothetical protein